MIVTILMRPWVQSFAFSNSRYSLNSLEEVELMYSQRIFNFLASRLEHILQKKNNLSL